MVGKKFSGSDASGTPESNENRDCFENAAGWLQARQQPKCCGLGTGVVVGARRGPKPRSSSAYSVRPQLSAPSHRTTKNSKKT